MDTLSVMGATVSLEFAILLIGLVLLLDLKRLISRRQELVRNMKATLDAGETTVPQVPQPQPQPKAA
jgi:hypothetical protein